MEIEKNYYDIHIKGLMTSIISALLITKPENPVSFLIPHLITKGKYKDLNKPLDDKERKELLFLRSKYLKVLEKNNKDGEVKCSKLAQVVKLKRPGVSSEAYGIYNKYEIINPSSFPKSGEQFLKILSTVRQCVFFSELSKKNLKIVIDAMKERWADEGEIIIRQGDDGDKLYFVESGVLECSKKETDGREIFIKNYFTGGSFGELALLYNCPRGASIKAKERSRLWELDRDTFKYIVRFQHEQNQTRYFNFLKKIDLFSNLNDSNIRQISEALKQITVKEGQVILRAGDHGDEFYIIERGCAYATVVDEEGIHQKVKFYKEGEFFGELALLRQSPRACNIFAEVTTNNHLLIRLK